jgi:hypothetical protein
MKDKDAERPPRPRRHRQFQAEPELEVDDEEPLDLELDSDVFPGSPSNKSILTEYGDHIARSIYENIVSYLNV